VRRFEITYGKPRRVAGPESGFSGGVGTTQEVVEREEVTFYDSFVVFADADPVTLDDVNILAIAWEPGMRVQEVEVPRPTITNHEEPR
jgi:hypothetical protein